MRAASNQSSGLDIPRPGSVSQSSGSDLQTVSSSLARFRRSRVPTDLLVKELEQAVRDWEGTPEAAADVEQALHRFYDLRDVTDDWVVPGADGNLAIIREEDQKSATDDFDGTSLQSFEMRSPSSIAESQAPPSAVPRKDIVDFHAPRKDVLDFQGAPSLQPRQAQAKERVYLLSEDQQEAMINLNSVKEREIQVSIREAQMAAREARLAARQAALETMREDLSKDTSDAVLQAKKIEEIILSNLGGSAEAHHHESRFSVFGSFADAALWLGIFSCSPCSNQCCNNRYT